MNRAPARPKRSTTPTSATFPSASDQPPSPQPQSSGGSGGTKPLYLCSPFVDAALVTGNFKTIVMLPKYVDVMEWVACNSWSSFSVMEIPSFLTFPTVFDFYQNLNLFYGVISECCTQQTCPTMSAGLSWVSISYLHFVGDADGLPSHPCRLNYTWINTDRKHVQLPAPTYVDYVMTWIQNLLDDENTFPTKSGV
jgi:MOB kinase activator 1